MALEAKVNLLNQIEVRIGSSLHDLRCAGGVLCVLPQCIVCVGRCLT